LLNVSMDSAYRRLRGETGLTLDETLLLCKKYNISLDTLLGSSQSMVHFSYRSIDNEKNTINTYLEGILKDFELLINNENVEFYFAAEDLPLFHFLEYEYLTPFKFFYWEKSILNNTGLFAKKFDKNHIDDSTLKLAKRLALIYSNIPSIEIWTEETILSTLSQINYYWEAGHFANVQDALNVINDLEKMISHIKLMADMGLKTSLGKAFTSESKNFMLYDCEVQIGNNSIFVQADKLKISLLSFNNFNSLQTFNLNYCLENEKWIKNLIKKSSVISRVSEKQRFQFFKKINELIQQVKVKIV
jgi:hypothetical protein